MDQIEKTVAALNRRGFTAREVTRDQLKEALIKLIPQGSTIGTGGSVTLTELGILKDLKERGYDVLSAETSALDWEAQCSASRNADYMLTSSNAISEDGCLVNIDGRGNRVANMIYGVENVFVIAGENKIEETLEKAVWRAKNVSAPKNCVRLKKKTPCVKTGKCEDCNSPDRICRATVIHTNPTNRTNIYVFLLREQLGY